MEQKINVEKHENNVLFCIDPQKAFAIKSIPRSVFRNPSHKNKICFGQILILVSLSNHDKTDCVSEQFCKKEWF